MSIGVYSARVSGDVPSGISRNFDSIRSVYARPRLRSNTILYYSLLYCIWLYYTVLYFTKLYFTILYYIWLYSTIFILLYCSCLLNHCRARRSRLFLELSYLYMKFMYFVFRPRPRTKGPTLAPSVLYRHPLRSPLSSGPKWQKEVVAVAR